MEHKKPNIFPRTIFLKDFENNGVVLQDSEPEPCSVESNISQNGNIVANQYELVKNILRNLPMKDLLNCCKVIILATHSQIDCPLIGLQTVARYWSLGQEGE